MIEVECYRRLAERACRREISAVEAPDAWFCKGGTVPGNLEFALTGRQIVGVRRIGKLLLADISGGPLLGLRFGMTGRLLVDGNAGIERLLYSSDRNREAWDRFRVRFADGGSLVLRDPRRLGGVELDPDLSKMGPDAAAVSLIGFRGALRSSAAVKAVLLDQQKMAGIGNLLADETLWRAGIAPTRMARSLAETEVKWLRTSMRTTIGLLTKRGGSHTGDLQSERRVEGRCPLDGNRLRHCTVGGRSTWWCEHHQM